MLLFFKIFICLALGFATAYFARERGRDPRIWLLIGLLFGIFGLILVFILPRVEAKSADQDEIEIFPMSSTQAEEEEEAAASPFLPRGYKSKTWFYLSPDHQQVGPLSFLQLAEKWELRVLTEDSFVWCEEMDEWHQIGELDLFPD